MAYVTRPRVYWNDDLEMDVFDPPSLTVFDDEDCVDTGLVDELDYPLYRVRDPIGFRVD